MGQSTLFDFLNTKFFYQYGRNANAKSYGIGLLRLYMQHIKLRSKWKIEKGKLTHLGGSSVKTFKIKLHLCTKQRM